MELRGNKKTHGQSHRLYDDDCFYRDPIGVDVPDDALSVSRDSSFFG